MKMNISKRSFGQCEVKLGFIGFSDPAFAKKLDFDVQSNLFLQKSENRDLFKLENGNEALHGEFGDIPNRFFEVFFNVNEYSDHFQFEFSVSEQSLKIGDNLEPYWDDMRVLWRERMRVRILESGYDEGDTIRVVHEFAASIALMIRDFLAE